MARGKTSKGYGMDQGLKLSYWLGIAGLALSSARILLWRTRRTLNQSRRDAPALEAGYLPNASQQDVRHVTAAVNGPTGSAIAS